MHAEKNVPSRVWAKALKKCKTKGNHHGIDPWYWVMIRLIDPVQVVLGSWYCFGSWYWKRGPWYWKRINLYKEKKFIVQIMSVGARCLSLNEYFSVKYIWMERVTLEDKSECMMHQWWRRGYRSEMHLYLLDLIMEGLDLWWGEHLGEHLSEAKG